jgi:hypothetical protein
MPDPFVGSWKLNPEKCEFDANHRPRAASLVFELDDQGYYLMKAEGLNEKGEPVVEKPARFVVDGKAHPLPDLPGLTVVSTRPDSNTLHSEAKREDGSLVGGGTYVVSEDGRSLTATNFGFDSQLRQFKQSTVWDRAGPR